MSVKELENKLERIESALARNIETKDVHAIIAEGVWQIALQLAKLNHGVEQAQ